MYMCICVHMCAYALTRAGDEGGGVTHAADWWGRCDTCVRSVGLRCDTCGRLVRLVASICVRMCAYVCICVYVCKCVCVLAIIFQVHYEMGSGYNGAVD